MNIFFVDNDSQKAAEALCDKHVLKMVIESTQLLCTAHHILNTGVQHTNNVKFYKQSYVNHPCNKWVRERTANYNWLANYALALCHEYTFRYNKVHASQQTVEYCLLNPPIINMHEIMSDPPQCMPDEYKDDNAVVAYRRYYNEYKRNTIQMKWTKRRKPSWFHLT